MKLKGKNAKKKIMEEQIQALRNRAKVKSLKKSKRKKI